MTRRQLTHHPEAPTTLAKVDRPRVTQLRRGVVWSWQQPMPCVARTVLDVIQENA